MLAIGASSGDSRFTGDDVASDVKRLRDGLTPLLPSDAPLVDFIPSVTDDTWALLFGVRIIARRAPAGTLAGAVVVAFVQGGLLLPGFLFLPVLREALLDRVGRTGDAIGVRAGPTPSRRFRLLLPPPLPPPRQ